MVNPAHEESDAGALIPKVQILGIKVSLLDKASLHAFIGGVIDRGEKHQVLNVNVHCMNLANRIPWLKDFLNAAPVVFCDGAGVMWAARILGYTIPERITYADWMWELGLYCERKGYSLFFLGGKPGVTQAAAERMRERFPRLLIKGCRDGYFCHHGLENDSVVNIVNSAHADILVLGMGMPKQEFWLKSNWKNLDVRIALNGGACFDFVSGSVSRCPRFMADHSMEWLYRLYIEPKRMFNRYVIGNPLFMFRVLREKIFGVST